MASGHASFRLERLGIPIELGEESCEAFSIQASVGLPSSDSAVPIAEITSLLCPVGVA
jgi:hypothetical protein